MAFNAFNHGISIQCFMASSPVWFSRGWTFSTPAAVLSGMVHTPLFSQQEKPHGGETSSLGGEREGRGGVYEIQEERMQE